ncbi:MAG: polysaccharide biosynthesis C-terminal domain-containing protein, partial [Gammaproteobacteria bacterium]
AALISCIWLQPWWTALFTTNDSAWTINAVWQQSLPLAPVSILTFLLLWVDTLMTAWLLGNHEIALYNVAARLSFISLFFLGALDASIYPRLLKMQQQPQHLRHFFWQATALVASLLGLVTLVLILSGNFLLNLFRPEYTQAATVLSLLLIAQLVRALSLTFGFMFIIRDKVHYLNGLLAFALLVALIAHLFLIPRYGIEGAALATLLANIILTGGTVGFFIRLRLLVKTRASAAEAAC